MATRSPNYPSIGLKAALEGAQRIWNQEKRSAFPPTVAVQHLGFTSINGASKARLAGLKQYGLIKNHDAHSLVLTPLAIKIMAHPENSAERETAIREAALSPKLFRELYETHPEASDATLRAYLITALGFVDDSAERAVKAFRATLRLVDMGAGGYESATSAERPHERAPVMPEETSPSLGLGQSIQTVANREVSSNRAPERDSASTIGGKELRFNISRDSEAQIFFSGAVTQEAIEKLAALLSLQKDTFPTKAELERGTDEISIQEDT